jgi:hypothetical protein
MLSERASLRTFRPRFTEPFQVEGVIRPGRYTNVPVLVVKDCGHGFLVGLWPDKLNPGRSHGKQRPFTYQKGEWWVLWSGQIHESDHEFVAPSFPLVLQPHPTPDDD